MNSCNYQCDPCRCHHVDRVRIHTRYIHIHTDRQQNLIQFMVKIVLEVIGKALGLPCYRAFQVQLAVQVFTGSRRTNSHFAHFQVPTKRLASHIQHFLPMSVVRASFQQQRDDNNNSVAWSLCSANETSKAQQIQSTQNAFYENN